MLAGMQWLWLVPAALVLDLALGDPRLPWRHPVCWIGSWLNWLEPRARRLGGGRAVGAACVVLTVLLASGLVWLLSSLPYVGPLFALYFAWAGLAIGSLTDTGRHVLRSLEEDELPEARASLNQLVSRETSAMDRPRLKKTLADTLSENFTDACIAPLFWLVVGGPAGLWMHRAVSTMDSMWGYRTPRWLRLGWGGARADDVLAWIPARLGVAILWLTDRLTGTSARWQGSWPGFRRVAAQASGMPSPNSGWSMTACAWLLGARMGGDEVYFGEAVRKPLLGPDDDGGRVWDGPRLSALCQLMTQASCIGACLMYAAALLIVLA